MLEIILQESRAEVARWEEEGVVPLRGPLAMDALNDDIALYLRVSGLERAVDELWHKAPTKPTRTTTRRANSYSPTPPTGRRRCGTQRLPSADRECRRWLIRHRSGASKGPTRGRTS